MKKEKNDVGPLLTDEQLGSLGSWAEYSDQELLVDEFLEEAKRVSAAIAADEGDRFSVDPDFMTPAVRALVAMRAFYFLGVLRGGEAYRKCIGPEGQRRRRRVFQGDPYFLEHEEERWNREPVPLELQNTFYFLDSLYSLPREELRKLLEMLGLSTEKKGGGGMSKSVYMQLSDIEAEISKASAVLCGAQTCVDSNFCEGNWRDFQALARYHGGNLQVLLSVVGSMLMNAESQISELEEMLHGESGKKEAAHE